MTVLLENRHNDLHDVRLATAGARPARRLQRRRSSRRRRRPRRDDPGPPLRRVRRRRAAGGRPDCSRRPRRLGVPRPRRRHVGRQATWTTRPTGSPALAGTRGPGWRHVHGARSSRSGSTGQPADRCGSWTTCSTSTATGARSGSSGGARRPHVPHPARRRHERLRAALDRLFPDRPPDLQRLAVAACVPAGSTVIAGGPGTGKTTTVARLLAVLSTTLDAPRPLGPRRTNRQSRSSHAGSGVRGVRPARRRGTKCRPRRGSTLHRLLGWRPDSHSRFRFNRHNHLPYDLVVIDETSMVSLTLMSRLLEALRPDTQLVLVGDPDQLASVEAGAVLGDLVRRRSQPALDDRSDRLIDLVPADVQPADEVESELRKDVVRLRTVHRYGSAIAELAEAIRRGRADDAVEVLRRGSPEVEFVETDLDARRPRRRGRPPGGCR